MLKGQQGGDFAPNGYQHTIDEEFGIGPTLEDLQPTEDGPNPIESKMFPQSQNLTSQYTNPQSRQRPRLGISPDLDKVVEFWENNPLFSGESSFEVGSKEYFEEHRNRVINDCFAGVIDKRIFPDKINCEDYRFI